MIPPPSVRFSSGRSGATSGTCVTSIGEPTAVTDAIGRSGQSAAVEQREDPAQAPADHVHRPAAGVRGHLADRGRHDLVDPVLHAEVAVAERDLAVLHEVGRPAAGHEVLDQRAAAAQVEAERRGGQRGDQEHRVAGLVDLRRPGGSGRPRAACRRRSGCAASGAGRPGRRRAPCGRRCWPRRRRSEPAGRASGSDPWAKVTRAGAARAAQSGDRLRSARAAQERLAGRMFLVWPPDVREPSGSWPPRPPRRAARTVLRIAFIRRVRSRSARRRRPRAARPSCR